MSRTHHRDCVVVRVLVLLVLLVADAECSSADVASKVRMVLGHRHLTVWSQSCHRSLATDAERSSADVASRRWVTVTDWPTVTVLASNLWCLLEHWRSV